MATLLSYDELNPTKTETYRDDGSIEHIYEARWVLKYDDSVAPTTIENEPALPSIGDGYGDTRARLRSRIIRQAAQDFTVWTVDMRWTYTGDNPLSPLLDSPIVSYGSAQYSRVQDTAWLLNEDGTTVKADPIRNAAVDPFDPPPEETETRLRIMITKNYWEMFDPGIATSYFNAINRYPVRIAGQDVAQYQAKIVNVEPSLHSANGLIFDAYTRVRWTIELHPESFESELLNQGYNYYDELGNKLRATSVDEDGATTPVTEPILLNEDGGKLDDGADPVYLKFIRLRPLDWSYLFLPEEDPKIA